MRELKENNRKLEEEMEAIIQKMTEVEAEKHEFATKNQSVS